MTQSSTDSISSMFDDVAQFHRLITREDMPDSPTMVTPEFIMIRYRFLVEETDEFMDACVKGDIVKAADALADICYVAIGTAYLMGLPFDRIWREVQIANMKKVGGATARNPHDAIKPPGWTAPDVQIAKILKDLIK